MKMNTIVTFLLSNALLIDGGYALNPFNISRAPFADEIQNAANIPQFITLTFDDAVTPQSISLFKPLTEIVDRNGCGIKATFFISGENTVCSLVQGLNKAGHEIATHTFSHKGDPSIDEISNMKTYLTNDCGIPAGQILGFRAPFLVSVASCSRLALTLFF